MTMIQRIRWHVVNGNVQWIWPDEDVLDAIYATLEHCEALIAAEKPITKEQAMAMVSNAEGHIWARIPPKHFISEYPAEHAAIVDLQNAHRLLGRAIRMERGIPCRMQTEGQALGVTSL